MWGCCSRSLIRPLLGGTASPTGRVAGLSSPRSLTAALSSGTRYTLGARIALQPVRGALCRAPSAARQGVRNCGTITETTALKSQPPFAMRVALVGTTVGLATPLLALGGVVFAWYRFLPLYGAAGHALRTAVSVLVGGGIVTLTWGHVGPFLANHADLVLPFALANTVTAAFWYAALEARLGLPLMAGRVPAEVLQLVLPAFMLTWGPQPHRMLPVG